MAQGMSIHIGLNQIDPAVYGPGNDLAGCINDAVAMQQLALGCGFQTTLMTDQQATAASVIQAISGASQSLNPGDILFLSYSGHGSQVPDKNSDETDGSDETWCCYDRMIIDDELYQLWAKFKAGVRIVMLSDSCHSGTMARMIQARDLAATPAIAGHYRALLSPGQQPIRTKAAGKPLSASMRPASAPPPSGGRPPASSPTVLAPAEQTLRFRLLPPEAAARAYARGKEMYGMLQHLTAGAKASIGATVILISGCQDNQLSADGSVNGLFTQNLLQVWNNGLFNGNHKQFHQQIAAQMPATQSPNFLVVGAANSVFEGQRPFTVTTDATNQPVATTLWVRGPDALQRSDPPPTFQVNPGPHSYFILEIASEADLFDTGANQGRRNDDNFYGSWSDSPHQTGISYTLPHAVWDRLKSADRLYYRIGSTATSTGWMDYMVSTPDQQWQNAPSFDITGAQAWPQPEAGSPSIAGPDSIAASDDPPAFSIDTAGAPYYIVEVTRDASLFNTDEGRNDDTFFGSWAEYPLQTDPTYQLPDSAWARLKDADQLYYRVGTTTSEEGWENYTVSTGDADWMNAPSFTVDQTRAPPAVRQELRPAY